MKILIISSGRAGSSALIDGLNASINNSIKEFEPFNPKFKKINFRNHLEYITNINPNQTYIEKNLIHDPIQHRHIVLSSFQDVYRLIEYDNEIFLGKQVNVVFYKVYSNNFDKIILLGRKNKKEIAKSWAHAYKNGEFFKKYTPIKNINYQKELKLTKKRNKQLLRLSKHLGVPLTWYEDLFSGSKNYIKYFLEKNNIQVDNLDILCNYLNPKFKYTL